MCDFYEVSRSGYYAWKTRGPSARDEENAALLEIIQTIHKDSLGTYGSPRIAEVLQQQGYGYGENRIARLMQENGIVARSATLYRARPWLHKILTPVPNRMRDVEVTGPNQVWVADITYLLVGNKWRYLAVVMDLFSRRIIGWSLGKNRKVSLTLKALAYAVRNRRPEAGLIFHSDRGVEYAAKKFKKRLKELGFIQSMNRAGKMTDNAHMESFFHSFKSDVYHGFHFHSDEMLRKMIRGYLPFYNQKRLHSGLNYLSPVEYEKRVA